VENNTIGAGATDVSQYSGGNNFAVWTNTIRTNPAPPVPLMSAGDWVEDSSNETTTSFVPETDLTVLDNNQTSGTQYVELGVPVASYPPGYQTQIVCASDDNWVLKADPAWNNFSANQPVGPNGLWIGINAQGLFTLLPGLSGIEGTPLAYLEGDSATVLTAALTASDPDSTTLSGATITISSNYHSGEDVLSFTNTAQITGNWNAATGTLTLSGSDTLADYQAALRSVTYFDTSLNPNNATRTVSFQVDDGLVGSNVVTRQITVTPIATWNGSATGNLSDPTKWVAGVTPNPAVDDLVLGGPTASSPVNDFPAGSAFQGLVFNGNCTLSGNSVLLDSTILNAQGNNSFSLPLVLDDAGFFQVSSGSLAVGGTINNSGYLLTVNTAASTTATFSGSISGSGGLVKSGTGTLVLTVPNSYSGSTAVLAGVLQVAAPGAIAPGAALTVGSGAVVILGSNSAGEPLQVATLADPAMVAASSVGAGDDSAAPAKGSNLPAIAASSPVAAAIAQPGRQSASSGSVAAWAALGEQSSADCLTKDRITLTAAMVDLLLSRRQS